MELIDITYRKVTRCLYKLPYITRNFIVNALDDSIEIELHRKNMYL